MYIWKMPKIKYSDNWDLSPDSWMIVWGIKDRRLQKKSYVYGFLRKNLKVYFQVAFLSKEYIC